MADLLTVENVYKTYRIRGQTLEVLKGASMCVGAGETVSIVGMSGAGKSTLLHILGGLDRPEQGRVVYDGSAIYDLSEGRRTALRGSHIGFVFQSYHLLPEMDVLENVMLPAIALTKGRSESEVVDSARNLLSAVGMEGRIYHRPFELSGGEQQRVALARALMNDPDLVLADEPTGNLDSGTGNIVLDYLFTLTRKKGHALVLVTHNDVVARTCDRMLRLQNGQLLPA